MNSISLAAVEQRATSLVNDLTGSGKDNPTRELIRLWMLDAQFCYLILKGILEDEQQGRA